mgnify:CR=1 FL=1
MKRTLTFTHAQAVNVPLAVITTSCKRHAAWLVELEAGVATASARAASRCGTATKICIIQFWTARAPCTHRMTRMQRQQWCGSLMSTAKAYMQSSCPTSYHIFEHSMRNLPAFCLHPCGYKYHQHHTFNVARHGYHSQRVLVLVRVSALLGVCITEANQHCDAARKCMSILRLTPGWRQCRERLLISGQ